MHRLSLFLARNLRCLFLLSTACWAPNSSERETILWKEQGGFANLSCKAHLCQHGLWNTHVYRLQITNVNSVIKTTPSLRGYINLVYFDWTPVSKDKLYYSSPRNTQKSLHHCSVKETNKKVSFVPLMYIPKLNPLTFLMVYLDTRFKDDF